MIRTCLAIVLAFATAVADEGPAPTAPERIEAIVEEIVPARMKEHRVPGTVVIVVDRNGVIHARGFGYADLSSQTPVDPRSTIFRIASVSKTFTALAVLNEVAEERLALDRPVGETLTTVRLRNPFDEPVTAEHLLTHTTGLDRRNTGMTTRDPARIEALGEHLARNLPPVVRHPGESFAYSNYGFALAGHLVEISSGRAFAEYMADEIFAPLGMVDSAFDLFDAAPRLATGYRGSEPARFEPGHTAPAGMMTTTAADMGRFMIAMLNGGALDGQAAIDARSIEAMTQPRFRNAPGLNTAYGYGLFVIDRVAGRADSVYHSGDMTGWSADVELFLGDGVGLFMASNSATGAAVHRACSGAIVDLLSSVPSPVTEAPETVDRLTDHSVYEGEYLRDGLPLKTFDRFPTLILGGREVHVGGRGRLLIGGEPYIEVEPGAFRRETGWGVDVVFVLDSDGRSDTLRTYGRTYRRVRNPLSIGMQRSVLLASLGLLALSAVIWVTRGVVAAIRKRPATEDRSFKILVGSIAVLYLTFMIGVAITAEGMSLSAGVPPFLVILLVVATVAAGLTVLLLPALILVFVRSDASLLVKTHYAVTAVAAVSVALILYHWNVVGLRL